MSIIEPKLVHIPSGYIAKIRCDNEENNQTLEYLKENFNTCIIYLDEDNQCVDIIKLNFSSRESPLSRYSVEEFDLLHEDT